MGQPLEETPPFLRAMGAARRVAFGFDEVGERIAARDARGGRRGVVDLCSQLFAFSRRLGEAPRGSIWAFSPGMAGISNRVR
jgi:hypothetical protein